MKEKLTAILLCIGMLAGMVTPLAAEKSEDFVVTQSDTYADEEIGFLVPVEQQTEVPEGYIGIYTAEDLDNVRNSIFANYILMNDIDLSGYDNWEPISKFDGIFDGNGFTISNLVMSITDNDANYNSIGLFGQVSGASIQNLSMQDCHITVENTVFGYVGVISGVLSNSEIDNCVVSGKIEYTNEEKTNTLSIIGGVSGNVIRSSVQNIKSDVNINVDFYNAPAYVGGMFGQIYDVNGDFTINNLQNEGNVIVYENGLGGCGGISGGLTFCSTTSTVENIMNSGNLQYTMNDAYKNAYKKLGNVGGVFGVMSAYDSAYVKVTKLKNIAEIQSNSAKSGGIVGSFQNPTGSGESFETGISYIEFTHMYNSGVLNCSDTYTLSQYETQGIGGLFGVIDYTETKSSDGTCSYADITISDSYNSGNILVANERDDYASYISGIIGMGWTNNDGNTDNSYNRLQLTNIYNIGNIIVLYEDNGNMNIHDIIGLPLFALTNDIDITSCYYPSYSNANCIVSECTPLSDTEMQYASSFVGFDFDNVWEIGVTGGYPYPTLRDNPHTGSKTLWCPTLNVTPGSASTQTHFEWYIISGLTDNATGFYLEVYDETNTLYPVTTTASGSTMYVVTMPQSPGNYTVTLYAIYEDGTRVKGNTVSYTVASSTSSISTTFDTSTVTLQEGDTFDFAGMVSTTAEDGLAAIQIDIHKADDDTVGITYTRKTNTDETSPLSGNTFDLSSIPSFQAGDTLTGTTQSITLSAETSWNIYLYAKDADGNTLGGSVVKRIDIVEKEVTTVIHAEIECTDPEDFAGNYRDFTVIFDELPKSAYLQFDNQHNSNEWLSDEYCSTNPTFIIDIDKLEKTDSGYEYNTTFIIHSEGLESNDFARKVRVAIPTESGIYYSDAFTFYVNPISENPQTTIGTAYEQTLDISDDTLLPSINSVIAAKKQDKNKNIYYRLSVLTYTADDNADVFFYWETDGGEFQIVNDDYTVVDFIPNGDNTITVYMGDSLGYVASYKLNINN